MRAFSTLFGIFGFVIACALPVDAGQPGKLTREIWNGVPGNQISEFSTSNLYYTSPSSVGIFSGGGTPTGIGNQYASRIRGYVIPAVSGDYRFYVAGNDSAELWLSTNDSKFTKQKIAFFTSATNERQWKYQRIP